MTPFQLLIVGVVCALFTVMAGIKAADYTASFAWFMAAMLVGIAAFITLLIGIITPITRGYDGRQCVRFGDKSGIPTKFVKYGAGWSWECFVKTGGKWIPKDDIILIANDTPFKVKVNP